MGINCGVLCAIRVGAKYIELAVEPDSVDQIGENFKDWTMFRFDFNADPLFTAEIGVSHETTVSRVLSQIRREYELVYTCHIQLRHPDERVTNWLAEQIKAVDKRVALMTQWDFST
ncbi:hypothetical protein N7466_011061 [Penicillium verhagenii]|uniref:uncharacterized protein n=1 Tax=Penicillium verhagenii TaxID=1562060 RepID=UPI0025458511|nr:uncharacterized protein N7466_011061 [Penicillium verhagenii]KAJ5917507.1 hypothetical protein N7466_011061 [Penicillium verhagenii]